MDVLSSLLGGESLLDVFSNIINGWLGNLVTSAFEKFDQLMVDLLGTAFHVENLAFSGSTTVLTAESIRNTYLFIYGFACSLVILKFLFKGFQIYILWRDGDADASPRDMMMGVIEAGVVMVSFPYLYNQASDIFIYLAKGIMGNLGISEGLGIQTVAGVITSGGLIVLLLLIFAIMVFIMWITLIKRGIELLILRLGVPFAAVGLIDSDMGAFKGYMQIFLKAAFTTVIQVGLLSWAFRVAGTFEFLNILIAIAIISAAFATPIMMQQFLVATGGNGGVTQKIYSAGMAARALRSLVR